MSLSAEFAPHLPALRRYARAMTGSQKIGDACVRAALEAMVAAPQRSSCSAISVRSGSRLPTAWAGTNGVIARRLC